MSGSSAAAPARILVTDDRPAMLHIDNAPFPIYASVPLTIGR